MRTPFDTVEKQLRSSLTAHQAGDAFEEMCCWFLREAAGFRDKFDGVWRWKEVQRGPDIGIDIVARHCNGYLWAVQVKWVASRYQLRKRDIDSFLAASGGRGFNRRLIIATTDNVGPNAKPALRNQRVKVDLVLRTRLCRARLDWSVWLGARGSWPRRPRVPPPQISVSDCLSDKQILRWADEHKKRTGRWPTKQSGPVRGAGGEKWSAIDGALKQGTRGLLGGSSLLKLLSEKRNVRHLHRLPPLTEREVLEWADEHHGRTDLWPTRSSGPVRLRPDETWSAIDDALRRASRGLSGNSSLPRLLAQHRGVRLRSAVPFLTEDQILKWADDHRQQTSVWPTRDSGPVRSAPGETWKAIDVALKKGGRGLHRGNSLTQLLRTRRGLRSKSRQPRLTEEQIMVWATGHRDRTGTWPRADSGSLEDVPEETWGRIDNALRTGLRGLPGGSGLADLLYRRAGVAHHLARAEFTIMEILQWADAHHRRTGCWPTMSSGQVREQPNETWARVNKALQDKLRGLPKDSPGSLAKLLQKHRKVRHLRDLPRLSESRILAWADEHKRRTGDWPSRRSGPVGAAEGETWGAIDAALRRGIRDLPGDSSLPHLLSRHRGTRIRRARLHK